MSQSLYQIQMETEIAGAPTGQKRKKKAKPEVEQVEVATSQQIDKQLAYIEITPKMRVITHFSEIETIPMQEGDEENEENDIIWKRNSKYRPHKDLVNAMKSLRKIALEICEMPIPDSKELPNYTVSALKISGDMFMRKSRAVLTISKLVKRTGKIVKIVTPQVVMFGDSDFEKHEEMSNLIQKVVEETWAYIGGKREIGDQLPLFERNSGIGGPFAPVFLSDTN